MAKHPGKDSKCLRIFREPPELKDSIGGAAAVFVPGRRESKVTRKTGEEEEGGTDGITARRQWPMR